MIEAALKDDQFLADIESARKTRDGFRLWWLGQSGFLIQWENHHALLDPYLSDSLTAKYAHTDKPHIRMTERVIDPARLNFIDVVSSSHNHTDHLDHETLRPLMRSNPDLRFVVPEANRAFVADRLKCEKFWPIGCDDGVSVEVGAFTFIGVASAHETLERDEHGRYPYLGYIVRFGSWSLYHSGDAVPYEGMADKVKRLMADSNLDVALLPINGRAPERRVSGNFFGNEAAVFAKAINARVAIPMHYDMFSFNTASPDLFTSKAERIGQNYRVLRCGESFRFLKSDNL